MRIGEVPTRITNDISGTRDHKEHLSFGKTQNCLILNRTESKKGIELELLDALDVPLVVT